MQASAPSTSSIPAALSESQSPGSSDWRALFPEPVAVLGYGVEGRSTLRHLRARGYRKLLVLDRRAPDEPLPDGVEEVFGEDYLRALDPDRGVRTAFRAPGLRPFTPAIEAFVARGGILTSQVEAAFALLGRARIIGVTGTVGKGTCCSLLSAMLDAGGLPHRLAGNIGLPPLDALEEFAGLSPDAKLLLELSSFQLSTLRESPALAVVLRTTTEHLDWHASQAEYWDHKANLVRFQQPGDLCVFYAAEEQSPGSAWIGTLGAGWKIAVGGQRPAVRLSGDEAVWEDGKGRVRLSETRLTGAFNLENVAAAGAAALAAGCSFADVRAGAAAFAPLEHRIEFVREAGNIRYFNDSYATRPEAALAAVRAFGKTPEREGDPVGLVLGGSEKYADFTDFATALRDETHVRAVALIGQTAERLEAELRHAGGPADRILRRCDGLGDALAFLRGTIDRGVILLSPACASFGLFANYKERGKAFKKLVNDL